MTDEQAELKILEAVEKFPLYDSLVRTGEEDPDESEDRRFWMEYTGQIGNIMGFRLDLSGQFIISESGEIRGEFDLHTWNENAVSLLPECRHLSSRYDSETQTWSELILESD